MIFAKFRAGFGSAVVGGTAQEGGEMRYNWRRPCGRNFVLPLLVGRSAWYRANSVLVDSLIFPVGCNSCHWNQAYFQVGWRIWIVAVAKKPKRPWESAATSSCHPAERISSRNLPRRVRVQMLRTGTERIPSEDSMMLLEPGTCKDLRSLCSCPVPSSPLSILLPLCLDDLGTRGRRCDMTLKQ